MRKQSGFTLIELMVVMAIIAILATAGLSGYGGYIKKARDTKRISDIGAIESVVLGSLGVTGTAPELPDIITSLSDMNNGKILLDPLDDMDVCLDSNSDPQTCEYYYNSCEGGGYRLRISFESPSNISRYPAGEDKLNAGAGINTLDYYELGNCDALKIGGQPGIDYGPIRIVIP